MCVYHFILVMSPPTTSPSGFVRGPTGGENSEGLSPIFVSLTGGGGLGDDTAVVTIRDYPRYKGCDWLKTCPQLPCWSIGFSVEAFDWS